MLNMNSASPSSAAAKLSREVDCQSELHSSSLSIGSACTQDPSCVIVGQTHMLVWKSPAPAKVMVVCIHGLGLCARAYKPFAEELSAAGIDGFGVNVRGFGPDREQSDRAKLNCVETVDDVGTLLTSIHRRYPDYRVILIGESMGGALAIRIAAEHPDLVDKIVCSAPAWKLLKIRKTAVKGVVELTLFPRSHPGPAGQGLMHQATTDPLLLEHWLTDPGHKLKLSLGEATALLHFIAKTDRYAKQLTKPVLVIQGLNDHLVSPKGVARLFKDIPCNNKCFLIDAKGEHLILEEARFTPPVMEKLVAWLKSESESGSSSARAEVEVVNDSNLSSEQEKKLSTLQRLLTIKVQ